METQTLDAQALLKESYTKRYAGVEKNDSPELSRINLIRRIHALIPVLPNNYILNIGSGPQSLERQFNAFIRGKGEHSFNNPRFFTVDFADIKRKKLLAGKNENVFHTQASGASLPFPDNSFGLVVSNHAIDFMPDEAFDEARRVLHPQGKAIFYFHHSEMIPDNLQGLNRDVAMFWDYLKNNSILFSSEEEVREKMTQKGFVVEACSLASGGIDKWWEVELRKGGEKL